MSWAQLEWNMYCAYNLTPFIPHTPCSCTHACVRSGTPAVELLYCMLSAGVIGTVTFVRYSHLLFNEWKRMEIKAPNTQIRSRIWFVPRPRVWLVLRTETNMMLHNFTLVITFCCVLTHHLWTVVQCRLDWSAFDIVSVASVLYVILSKTVVWSWVTATSEQNTGSVTCWKVQKFKLSNK